MINVTKLKLILSPYAYHSDNHHHTELKLLLLQNQSSEQNEHLLPPCFPHHLCSTGLHGALQDDAEHSSQVETHSMASHSGRNSLHDC